MEAQFIIIARRIANNAVLYVCANEALTGSPTHSMLDAVNATLLKYKQEAMVLIASLPIDERYTVARRAEASISFTYNGDLEVNAIDILHAWFDADQN